MIAAAILHDTVEDTEVTIEQISQEFGDDIAMLVYWLTDKSQKSDGNRKVRKAIDRQHIAEAPDDAQIIKLADLIDNTSSIVAHDKRFAQVYLDEKEALLNVMSDATKSTAIYEEAQRVLFFGKQKLSEE
jgi:(p)ppGpp synthase/HD superfamily hydrolase